MIDEGTTPANFIVGKGHVPCLRAREGGVLVRAGHTERSVDTRPRRPLPRRPDVLRASLLVFLLEALCFFGRVPLSKMPGRLPDCSVMPHSGAYHSWN